MASRNRTTLRKTFIACAVLSGALLLVVVLTSLVGSERLPAGASLCALLSFGRSQCTLTSDQFDILFQIRLPRILLAAAVGGSLATAGASYQALLRNPLAEPYLLGISNGAAVGTMIALVFFGASEWSRPLLAFVGALLATLAVYRLARGRAGATPERLVLAGVIVTTFLSSVIVFVTTLMDATRIRSFTSWLLGDLSGLEAIGRPRNHAIHRHLLDDLAVDAVFLHQPAVVHPVANLDAADPLLPGRTRISRRHQPQRPAMNGWNVLAVHGPRQQRVGMQGFGDGQAARQCRAGAAQCKVGAVVAGIDRAGLHPASLQQCGQWCGVNVIMAA